MSKKKLVLQIGAILLSVLLIFFGAFLIGSKGGRYPLFFLNQRTVSKIEGTVSPEASQNTPDEYSDSSMPRYLSECSQYTCSLKPFESDKAWKYKTSRIIYLKPFGRIVISMPHSLSQTEENKNLISINGIVFSVE